MKGIVNLEGEENKRSGRDVFIIRHGQTDLNARDVIRGWFNPPLDEKGIMEARRLGEEMAENGVELDGLITSDLLRCVETSLEVSKMTGIPILETTKVLRPWNVGTLTGTDGKSAHKVMMEHARKFPNKPVGAPDTDDFIGGAESFNVFRHRMLTGIIGILNRNRGLKIGLVSHSRGERCLHAWVAAGCPADLSLDLDVFGAPGEAPATAAELIVDCPLVLS